MPLLSLPRRVSYLYIFIDEKRSRDERSTANGRLVNCFGLASWMPCEVNLQIDSYVLVFFATPLATGTFGR